MANGATELTLRSRQWTLPLFTTEANKYLVGSILYGIAIITYLASNHFHFFTPMQLPMSKIDEWVPFIPHTVWIYSSEYYLFALVYIFTKDSVNLGRYIYSFFFLQLTSVIIFWVWPTTFPRGDFPLPENLDFLTTWLFSTLRTLDTPANCAPSLHVSCCYLSAFNFLNEQREKFPFFFGWATAVAVATLTTKQHYIIDVITGFGMAVLFYWIFTRFFNYSFPREAN